MESGGSPALTLLGVSKGWPRRPDPVLDHVDLEVEPGVMMWLAGDNGAGKTTLLRIVCGLLAPDDGRVLIGPFDLEDDPGACKRSIGFLSAGNSGLYARLTARQQLRYWSRLAYVPPAEREGAVAASIEAFGLTQLADRRLDRISMGERQRVRLAMAFLHQPELVLLDEPRTSLDGRGLALLGAAIEELRARGGTAIWSSPSNERPELAPDLEVTVRSGRLETP